MKMDEKQFQEFQEQLLGNGYELREVVKDDRLTFEKEFLDNKPNEDD